MLDLPYFEWKYSAFTQEELNTVYDEESGTTYNRILTFLCPLFQNIFENEFSDTKTRVEHFWAAADFENEISLITEAFNDICSIISSLPAFHPNKMDEQINTRELYFSLIEHIDAELPKHNIISVKAIGYKKEEIKKEFDHYLQTNVDLDDLNEKMIPYRWGEYLLPHGFSLKGIQKKHSALKAKQTFSRPKAIDATFPNDGRDPTIKERHYDRLVADAKAILKNAELGVFPGNY